MKNHGFARKRALLVLLLLGAVLFVVATGSAEVEVEAEGIAALERGADLGKVRDEALRDAWRRAVEFGVGLVLRADLYVANKQAISQEIWTAADGYVKRYKVLREGDDGVFYRISIFAVVDMLGIGRSLEELGLAIESIGNPRAVVLVDEWSLGEKQPFSVAEAALRRAFCDKGFTVLRFEGMADDPRARQATEGDLEAAVEIARAFDADITIVGNVRADPAGSAERGSFTWYSAAAFVDFSAVLRDTGETLSSVSAEETVPKLSLETAGTEAIKEATDSCLPQLIIETIAGLNYARGSNIRALKLLVAGVESFSQAQGLKRTLASLREVTRVDLRTFDAKLSSYDLVYLGPSEALAEELESQEFTSRLRDALEGSYKLAIRSLDFAVVEAELSRR